KTSREIFDYGFLMSQLGDYQAPRDKITRLLRTGHIIRVKKGLYVFGENDRRSPVDRMLLANLLYGPSYISQRYALAFYGLIPERVQTVTSMTTQRHKYYETPFGLFEYLHLSQKRFTVGVDWIKINEAEHCLVASPEKALADLLEPERDLSTEKILLEHL